MDYINELEKIEKRINEKKIEKAKLEQQRENLASEIEELDSKIDELVPKGKNVDEWLKEEREAVEKGIQECQLILSEG